MRIRLPIDEVIPEIVATVRDHRAAVVVAPPGAGKTTRVPPALLDAVEGQIVVLEPRREAARAAARRMAQEAGCRLGDRVGYRIRLDRCESAGTSILVVRAPPRLGVLGGPAGRPGRAHGPRAVSPPVDRRGAGPPPRVRPARHRPTGPGRPGVDPAGLGGGTALLRLVRGPARRFYDRLGYRHWSDYMEKPL